MDGDKSFGKEEAQARPFAALDEAVLLRRERQPRHFEFLRRHADTGIGNGDDEFACLRLVNADADAVASSAPPSWQTPPTWR